MAGHRKYLPVIVLTILSLFSVLHLQLVAAIPTTTANTKRQLFGDGSPSVTISNPSATIVGTTDSFLGIIPGKINSFKGIPFAQPPVGPLRLKPPQKLTASLGTVQATNALPPAC